MRGIDHITFSLPPSLSLSLFTQTQRNLTKNRPTKARRRSTYTSSWLVPSYSLASWVTALELAYIRAYVRTHTRKTTSVRCLALYSELKTASMGLSIKKHRRTDTHSRAPSKTCRCGRTDGFLKTFFRVRLCQEQLLIPTHSFDTSDGVLADLSPIITSILYR